LPELPDVVVYIECLAARIAGATLERVRLTSPFVLRSVDPPLAELEGKRVIGLRRIGKRIVLGLEADLFLVVHLMIAGRLRWREPGRALGRVPPKNVLATLEFSSGTLLLTEASSKKRASLHAVRGEATLATFDPGGLEVLAANAESFRAALLAENHTLKRALTDPTILSGIGNAYSDEILHRARLSPLKQTSRLGDAEIERLHEATRATLAEWIDRLRREAGSGFPENVTAFRPEMAVHGRYRKPCPECGAPVQRIVHAENESNYCASCQTGGRLLMDRALSRLLQSDWPRTLEELEERTQRRASGGTGGARAAPLRRRRPATSG
jgi:formamidopyrimidine-DNA glycosylase